MAKLPLSTEHFSHQAMDNFSFGIKVIGLIPQSLCYVKVVDIIKSFFTDYNGLYEVFIGNI
jgi:hypothetical protein